jgi:uncharacterized oxidoreductase
MSTIYAEKLGAIVVQIFEAVGATSEEASAVAEHLVDSDLYGQHGHGVLLVPRYLEMIRSGATPLGVNPNVVKDSPCAAVVDGNGGLGQWVAGKATRLAIDKAKRHGLAMITLRNTSHIGRIGAYCLMAAKEGLLGLAFANAGRLGIQVAPYGGIDGRLSTNPVAFAAPRKNAEPFLLDMATSVVADGKIKKAVNEGSRITEGWVINPSGESTTDPLEYLGPPRGALLPVGGVVGYKGYGLSMVVELLGGALSGAGCAREATTTIRNGLLLCAIQIEHFTELDQFYEEVESLIEHIRSSRIAPGFDEILIAGEPEFRKARSRRRDGIELDQKTWANLCNEGTRVGVDVESVAAA